jgi:hypothetical protein
VKQYLKRHGLWMQVMSTRNDRLRIQYVSFASRAKLSFLRKVHGKRDWLPCAGHALL